MDAQRPPLPPIMHAVDGQPTHLGKRMSGLGLTLFRQRKQKVSKLSVSDCPMAYRVLLEGRHVGKCSTVANGREEGIIAKPSRSPALKPYRTFDGAVKKMMLPADAQRYDGTKPRPSIGVVAQLMQQQIDVALHI